MSKAKLEKFAEIATFPNVVRNVDFKNPALINCHGEKTDYRGIWSAAFFQNERPVVLELACGKGEYTVEMAQHFPEKNFIGVDLKGNRIWTGARRALDLGLKNAAFLRTRIELLPFFFAQDEISEIWITFPDPFLRKSKAQRRLTSPFFLAKYRLICRHDAVVHLKTDDLTLFEFSKETASQAPCNILEINEDVYKNGEPDGALAIKTFYEKMHLAEGRTIRYLKFRLQ